jgi:hypothetical protein
MKKFTFVGCSFTVGVGLNLEKSDPDNYTQLVSNKFEAVLKNIAVGGNSNYNIFISALNDILFETPDVIFVQWSALNRLWVYPGPDTSLQLSHIINKDYQYKDLYYSKKDLQYLTDHWHILNHDFKYISDLINYCNILEEISNGRTQIVFINGLVPWTEEIVHLNNNINFSSDLSEYTKELLSIDSRDDAEITDLFLKLKSAILSLNKSLWVNKFNSMYKLMVDLGTDKSHPGPKSHQLYADMIITYLEGKNV